MIVAILAAMSAIALPPGTNNIAVCGPSPAVCRVKVSPEIYGQAVVDVGQWVSVCGTDANRPDLTVCIAGPQHRIMFYMPYPPCGTPEAKKAPVCAEWKIGRPW